MKFKFQNYIQKNKYKIKLEVLKECIQIVCIIIFHKIRCEEQTAKT